MSIDNINGIPIQWDDDADKELFKEIPLIRNLNKMTPNIVGSKNNSSNAINNDYPFSKELVAYDCESLGRAFFSNGSVYKYPSFEIFDSIDILKNAYIKVADEPIFISNIKTPVFVFITNNESEWADKYSKLFPYDNEIGVFILFNNTLDLVQLKIGMGNSVMKQSVFSTKADMQRFIVSVSAKDFLSFTLSAKDLLEILNINQPEPILNNLNINKADQAKANDVFIAAATEKKEPINKTNDIISGIDNTQKEITITIGVFFDGTDNNRYNTELIYNRCIDPKTLEFKKETFDKIKNKRVNLYNPYTQEIVLIQDLKLKDDSSFENPYSNIVLMHDIYKTNANSKTNSDIIIKQYVQGIGTNTELDESGIPIKFKSDDPIGEGTGRGDTGIIKRTEEAAKLIATQIINQIGGESVTIKNINVDLFGFSRGAAAARHFANDLNKIKILNKSNDKNPYKEIYGGKLGELLWGKKIVFPGINIRFIGLFDTVVGDFLTNIKQYERQSTLKAILETIFPPIFLPLKLADIALDSLSEIELSLKNITGKVVQIQAMTEWRANFPLVISDAPNKMDINLFGSHSDIGGGYAFKDYETIIDAADISNQSDLNKFEKLRNYYKNFFAEYYVRSTKKYFYKSDQIVIEKKYDNISIHGIPSGSHYWLVDRRKIDNKLSLVAFKAMWEMALKYKLPLEISEKQFIHHEISNIKNIKNTVNFYDLGKDEDLLEYNSIVQELIKNENNEKTIIDALKTNLMQKFVHISADYNDQQLLKGKGDKSLSLLYANRPTKDGNRVIYKPRKK